MRPLSNAVQYNQTRMIKLLLDAGANRSAKDEDDMTNLHSAGAFGDIKTLRILKDAQLCCLSTSETDRYGWTPLEAFDMGRLKFHPPEDTETRQQCREAFVELLESVRQAGPDHFCSVHSPASTRTESPEIFEGGEIESSHGDGSDDELFFDTRSTFEDDDLSVDDLGQDVPT